jgi:LL-diaminopimelate aminotransferase
MQITPSDRLGRIPKYAFAEINKAKAQLKASGADVIDFGVGDPSTPTPDFVIEELQKAAQKHAGTGYPDYTGSMPFLEASARYMKRTFNVDLDPKTELSSSIGSKEAIFNFPEAFVNPGDVVICPSPGYPPYKTGTIFAEGTPFYAPLLKENDYLIDFASIPQEIADKAKLIWINYPNSPTGALATREYYEALVAWAHKNDIIIASDEGCYIDIYFDEKPLSILEVAKEGIVTFYSLSKRNNMTGYRVGFVAGDAKVIEVFKRLKTNIDSGTPNFVQDAAIVALDDDKHRGFMCDLYLQKRAILKEAIEAMGLEFTASPSTFYIWQKVPAHLTDVEFAKKLLNPEIALIVTPGSLISDPCTLANGESVNPGAGYVRFALMPTLEQMKVAAERLKAMDFKN